jgi:hypothetical protein
MNAKIRLYRFLGGFALVAVILMAAFSFLFPWFETWGATPEEAALVLPGDELLSNPLIDWTNAITIKAPPEKVWPWIAQIGDRRAGFYSFTFIENMVAGGDIYHNANKILPEFQDPKPGVSLIGGALEVREVHPGEWMLGSSTNDLGWTWIWSITPTGDGDTRLVVRIRIQPPASMGSNALVEFFMKGGAFIMEEGMIKGIHLRAEGGAEPGWFEPMGIVTWGVALLIGLAAGVVFMVREPWQVSLGVGVAAILALLVFTYLQPDMWIRLLVNLALLAGLYAAIRIKS